MTTNGASFVSGSVTYVSNQLIQIDAPAAVLGLEASETESRVLILADQFVIADPTDGETSVAPFVFEDGAAYMENAYIGTVYFKQMSSFNGKLVLKGSGTDASIELFS